MHFSVGLLYMSVSGCLEKIKKLKLLLIWELVDSQVRRSEWEEELLKKY